MNKTLIYISILTLVLASCGSSKDVATKKPTISGKEYPYIMKFHEGVRLKVKGRYDEAIQKFEECLAMRDNDDAVYYALSELELSKGNMEKSSQYITKAAELSPQNTWYIQELAYMYFEQKLYNKSAENFKKLVDIEPRNVDWQYGYAEALVQIGETEKAVVALNKTEDQLGVNPVLSIHKYNLFMSIKQTDKALNELNEAKRIYPDDPQLIATYVDHYFSSNQVPEAIKMLEELVIADPENGRAHLALADIYRNQGEHSKAYGELKLAFLTNDVDLDTKMKILINIHETSFKIDPEVYELVDLLVVNYPREAKAYSIKGDYLLRAEKNDEALKSYQNALQFDNSQYPIWNQVLIMEYQAGSFEELYRDSKECLTLFPSIATVYLLQAVSANQLKKYNEALDASIGGVELVVSDKPLEAEFYGQMGDAYFGLLDFDNGKKNYNKAINLDKQSSLLKNNFAYRLSMVKLELELANSLAKQACEAAPNQSQFIDTYGWVLFQQGLYDKAFIEFKKAFEINADDDKILEHLGDANFKLGNIAEALKWWSMAIKLSPDDTHLMKKIEQKKYYEPVH